MQNTDKNENENKLKPIENAIIKKIRFQLKDYIENFSKNVKKGKDLKIS